MLDKAIQHKKEYRKEYRGSKRFDRSCRNNKSCAYCRQNRMFNNLRRELFAKQEIEAALAKWNKAFRYERKD